MLPMAREDATKPVLDAEHAAFIQGSVSVIVAARDAELVADVVRGCGCRVSADRRRVTVLVDAGRADAVLRGIGANGMIAVVFTQPSTHRTIQLKGTDARLAKVTAADRRVVARNVEDWVVELTSIGYRPEFARVIHGGDTARLAAITFTPANAFQQTPGPRAGERLHS